MQHFIFMPAEPCIYDLHTHTFLCRHAEMVMPRVYFKLAAELGYKGVAYCCHNPFPGDSITPRYRMAIKEFTTFMAMYRQECEFARTHIPGLDILLTMEVDYLPANPSLTEAFVRDYLQDFDAVLGSLHYYERIGSVGINASANANADAETAAFVRQYFQEWVQALRTGWFNVMAHLDFIKVVVGMKWTRQHRAVIQDAAEQALQEMVKYNTERAASGLDPVALELNTGGTQYGDDFLPTESILAYAAKLGIPMCISSDCHQTVEIGRNFREALQCLQRLGVTELCYFKKKRICKYPVSQAARSYKPQNMGSLVAQIKRDKAYSVSVDQEYQRMLREIETRTKAK